MIPGRGNGNILCYRIRKSYQLNSFIYSAKKILLQVDGGQLQMQIDIHIQKPLSGQWLCAMCWIESLTKSE